MPENLEDNLRDTIIVMPKGPSNGQTYDRKVVLWSFGDFKNGKRLIVEFHNDLFRALTSPTYKGPDLTVFQLLRDIHKVEFGDRNPIALRQSRNRKRCWIALNPGHQKLANDTMESVAGQYARSVAEILDTYKLVVKVRAKAPPVSKVLSSAVGSDDLSASFIPGPKECAVRQDGPNFSKMFL